MCLGGTTGFELVTATASLELKVWDIGEGLCKKTWKVRR
jgi:hypothetical protein